MITRALSFALLSILLASGIPATLRAWDIDDDPDPFAVDGLSEEVSGFADLLAELRARKVQRPFHALARLRFLELARRGVDPFEDEEDLLPRAEELVKAAADPGADLPEREKEILRSFRRGEAPPISIPGLPPECFGPDVFEIPDHCFDIELEEGGEFGGSGEEIDFAPDLEDDEGLWPLEKVLGSELPDVSVEDEVNPFRIYRARRRLARKILAPPELDSWCEWFEGDEETLEAVEEGLGEYVGTRRGREDLYRVLARVIPLRGARVLARAIGKHGLTADLDLLEAIARLHPSVGPDIEDARERIQERLARYEGLGSSQRRRQASLLVEQAASFARRGDLERALRLTAEATELHPGNLKAQFRRALYAYQRGYYSQAREALEVGFLKGAEHYRYYTTYAKVMRRQGETEELRQFLEKALDRGGPTMRKVRLCNELALEYTILGLGEEAVRLARIALSQFIPEEVKDNLWTRYAEGKFLLGEFEEAERAYRRALRMDPGYRKARTGLETLQGIKARSEGQ